jgi:hypothetical protein
MNKVFVPPVPHRWNPTTETHRPAVDVSSAFSYGESVILLPFSIANQARVYDDIQGVIDEMKLRMIDSVKEDYVLAVGDPALIAAVAAIQIKKFGYVRLLRWDRETEKYRLVEVRL